MSLPAADSSVGLSDLAHGSSAGITPRFSPTGRVRTSPAKARKLHPPKICVVAFLISDSVSDKAKDTHTVDCHISNEITSILIHKEEIAEVIKLLPLNKASGTDQISHKMLRNVADTIS